MELLNLQSSLQSEINAKQSLEEEIRSLKSQYSHLERCVCELIGPWPLFKIRRYLYSLHDEPENVWWAKSCVFTVNWRRRRSSWLTESASVTNCGKKMYQSRNTRQTVTVTVRTSCDGWIMNVFTNVTGVDRLWCESIDIAVQCSRGWTPIRPCTTLWTTRTRAVTG